MMPKEVEKPIRNLKEKDLHRILEATERVQNEWQGQMILGHTTQDYYARIEGSEAGEDLRIALNPVKGAIENDQFTQKTSTTALRARQ